MKPLSRRAMLRGGAVCLGLPLLDAMIPTRARADGPPVPKRLVIFYTPNGTNDQSSASEGFARGIAAGPITTLPNEATPLETLKSKLLMVTGVNAVTAKGHPDGTDLHSAGMSEILTGAYSTVIPGPTLADAGYPMLGQGISIDQYIANAIGSATPRPSLQFGVQSEITDQGHFDGFCRMVYTSAMNPTPAITNPADMFARIFMNNGSGSADMMATLRAQRRSVLDFVKDDFSSLAVRLGRSDQMKLNDHLDYLRSLESSLVGTYTTPMGCGTATFTGGVNSDLAANFPQVGQQQMDLLKLSLQCDVTRVASLQWSFARSTLVHTWNTDSSGHPLSAVGHHQLTHNDLSGSPPLAAINIWYAQQLAYLATQLDSVMETDGSTMLDNTIIWWCTDVSWGASHTQDNIRVFLLGGKAAQLRQGEHVILPQGQPHQKLLVTLMNAMGVAGNRFGDTTAPDHGGGAPIPIEAGNIPQMLVAQS